MMRPPSWLNRCGWPLPAAFVVLAAATWLAAALAPGWRAEADRIDEQTLQLRRDRALAERASDKLPAGRPGTDIAVWPGGELAPERVADVLELAIRHSINVQRTQQRLQDEGGKGGLQPLRVTMTASGTYADLRRFVGESLQSDPALALERLSLRRGSEAAVEYVAEMQWLLVQRAARSAP